MRYLLTQLKERPIPATRTICYCPITPTRDAVIKLWQKETAERVPTKPLMAATTVTKFSEDHWLIGPGIGGAAACLYLEPYLASGTTELILFGTCASLDSQQLDIGEIFSPNSYRGDENIAKYYRELSDSASLETFNQSQLPRSLSAKVGGIWTTDLANLESPERSEHYLNSGAIGVDMEAEVLAQLAANYHCKFLPLLVTTDILGQTWTKGFNSSKVKESIEKVAGAIISLFMSEKNE